MLLLLLGCSVLSSFTSKAPSAPLTGHVAIDDTRITVYNDGATEWSNVVATANGTLVCTIGAVHAHDQAGLNLANCTGGPLATPVVGVRVVADQGFLEAAAAPAVAEPPIVAEPGAAADPAAIPAANAPVPATPDPVATSQPTAVSRPSPASAPAATAAAPASSSPAASTSPSAATASSSAPASSSSAPASASSGAMSLSAAISGGIGPARRLTVFNNSSFGWTGCVVTANDLYSYRVAAIEAGGHNGIMMIKFKDQAGNLFTSTAQVTRVKVKCDQGSTPVVLPS